jgi:hypothetical protein
VEQRRIGRQPLVTTKAKGKKLKVRIYVEGGASEIADVFREGWVRFFERAGFKDRMPSTISGAGRAQTFDRFKRAVEIGKNDELPLLLLDSEDIVASGKSNWQHLKERKVDNFDKPKGAGDDDAYLMICTMETWFLADREALKTFFPGLNENRLPAWKDLEKVPKDDVYTALDGATKACEQSYSKGRLSFELLGKIDPIKVEDRCPAAKRLLDRLRQLLP